jgi:hypothetical protein
MCVQAYAKASGVAHMPVDIVEFKPFMPNLMAIWLAGALVTLLGNNEGFA